MLKIYCSFFSTHKNQLNDANGFIFNKNIKLFRVDLNEKLK